MNEFKCPRCGAPISASLDDFLVCEYCGCTFQVDSFSGADAINRRRLQSKLERSRDYLRWQEEHLEETESAKVSMNNARKRMEAAKSGMKDNPILWIAGAVWLFLCVEAHMLLLGVISFLGVFLFAEKKKKKNLSNVRKNEQAYRDKKLFYDELMERQPPKAFLSPDYLPEEYRQLDAINSFISYLSTGRADTLGQAINLYEQELHNRRMERKQEEHLRRMEEEQREHNRNLENVQRDNGSRAAASTAAGIVGAAVVGEIAKAALGAIFDRD